MLVKKPINMPTKIPRFYVFKIIKMITKTSFASISELRDKTATIVKQVNTTGKKIILSQNKPVGVLLSIDEYNALLKLSFPAEKASLEDIRAYQQSSHWKDGVEAFSFLDGLE
jgi:prevent-host-death family protein